MSKKGILSFLLAIVMIATNFTQVFAYNPAGSSAKGSKELSVKTVEDRRGNKKNSIEISQLEGTKTTRSLGSSLLRYARFANQQSGTRSAEETWDAEINVNISTFGIGGQSFDWDEVFGKGETFTVQAFYYDADGQRINVGTPQTVNKGGKNLIFTATLPKSATSINLETSFIDKIGIKAYERSDNGVGDGNGKYAIDLELHQIYNPVINVMWLNPYGTKVRGAGDAKASFNDVEFNIIDSNRQMNLRDEDILVKGADGEPEDFIDVQDLTDLTGKNIEIVDANEGTVTYGDRTFKVTVKNPTAKDPGEIKFIEQPKIITPGDNDKPGNVAPDGYKRLSFHAESAANAQDGLFNDTTKVKIIDVLEGTKFNDAELLAKVGTIAKPYPVINGKKDANKKFLKWNPALPTDKTTGDVADTNYWPVYIANGDKIDENDKLPEGAFKVKVVRDEKSIQEDKLYGQTYAVFDGKTLAGDKFPELKAADNYRNPKWMTDAAEAGKPMEKIDAPWTKVIKKDTTFKATAAEDAATQIGQNGLKAVDTTALQGQDLTEAFWHEGVALGNTVRDEDKANFAALLKEATVTDLSNRTSEKVEDQVGTLLVTFKDGSTLKVENQKLIVKPNTVTVELDKDAQGTEKPLRDGDTVVKGKVTANATENKENGYKVNLEGAVVTIKDKAGKTIGVTLADKDGNFTAGTRELKAGEDISVVVTLPQSKTESEPVTKKVQLNPDKLNNILPTADKLLENLKGKPGVSKAKLDKLEEAIKAGKALIDEKTKKPAASVTVDADGQKSLDNAYETIKKAMEDLTENQIPMISGPDHKEIFVGGEIDLDKDIKVVDDNIKQVDGKDYTYKIYDASGAEVKKAAMVAKDGVYRVVYSAEDAQGVKAEHTMTVVVKKTVVEISGEFPKDIPEGYVKVEFKSGEHAGLNGVSKFLVQKGAQKSVIKEPTIIPKEGYKVAEPKWSKEIPATFADNFETEAQVIAKVTTTEPEAKDKDKYAKLTFEKGDHGDFAENAKTSIWVLKGEKVQFNAPKVNAKDGFTFAGWDPELKESYDADQTHTAQYASNSDISDTEVKGFQEVKFLSGTDGKFEGDKTEKSVWVRPGKLVDLRTKAPKVTVTTKGKSFIGWDQDLVQTFTKGDQATVINAKYDDTVKTTEPDAKDKEKYAKVDFSAGNLGKIENNQTTTYWVVKDEKVTDTFKVPSVTANKGWKVKTGKDAWSPKVAESYSKDTIHVAQYDYDGASVIPQKPGEDKPAVPDNFVKVEFKKGEHGVISSEETTVYWVDPTKPVTAEFKAPKVIADTNYKHTGWDPALTEGQTFAQKTDIVAQYKSTVVTEDPKDANYVTVEFDAKDHGTLKGDAKFWVYKNEKVSITAPKVTAKAGYTFDKWDPAVKDSYAEATVHNATYTTNNNVSDTEVEGYNKVTFKAGDHGTLTEKSVWVKPDTLVDLTDKAPEVKANDGYSHIGWKPALIGKFENNTEIVAQYSNSISDTPVEGWTELTFDQGDHGKFAKGAKNVKWVNPKADLKLKDIAPAIVADTNYSLDGWKDGETKADLEKAQKFETAKTFTAAYKSNVLDEEDHDKLTPEEKKNFVQITFAEGKNGKFPKEAVKEVYVKKDVVVDLTEKAPTVIPNQGYGHSGWEPALKSTFSAATTITAQYKAGTFDENAIKEIMVVGPTKMGYGEGEKLDLTGLKVIAKDDAGLQKTYDGVEAIKAAHFNIAPADKTELKMEDNGKHIVVTKGEGNDKVTGQTETTLTIHENKSAKAEDVKALNQNKVVDGKVTNEPKDTTTVTGKVKPGSTVVIKDENGKDITPKDGVKVENGSFTAEVTKQDEGKKVQVIVTEKGKQPSEPADATVARDANNDGKADGDADQRTKTPTAKALNQGENPASTTITGKAEPGAKVVAKVGDVKVGEATADAQTGEYKIEAKKDGAALGENTDVKVTAQVDGKLESEPATATVETDKDGNGVADKDEQTERPAAIASNKGTTPAFTTIAGKTEPGAKITVTLKDGTKVKVDEFEIDEDGNYTLQATVGEAPLANGAEILVYAKNAPKKISNPQTTTVFNDFNNDGKPDGGKVDLEKIKDIQVIDPNKMTYVEGTDGSLDLTGLKVVVRDTLGGIEVFEYDTAKDQFKDGDTVLKGFKVKVGDKEVKQDTPLTSADHNNKKITVGNGQKSGDTIQALKVTKTLPAPEVDNVQKGDTKVKVKVPTNGETKIIVKVGDKEVVAEKDSNGQWKVGDKSVNTVDDKLEIPVDSLKQGDVVKVTAEDPAGNKGVTEKKVPVDEYSSKPTDLKAKNEPATPNKTTVTGKATPGAVITITGKDGKVLTTDPAEVKADRDGNFTATIDKKDPNTLLLVTAKEKGKEPSAEVPAQVEGSSDVIEKKPGVDKPEGFYTVTFAIKEADKDKGTLEGAKEYYVNPKVDVQLNPPIFKAATGYKLTGWDQAGKLILDAKKYTADTTIYAVIGEVPDTIPAVDPNTGKENEKPAGYVEVKFGVDTTKAKFNDVNKTKFYVNPTKEIELTAPEVTVTDKAYTFKGWDNTNWNQNDNKFNKAKYEADTLITAKLSGSEVKAPTVDDVKTGDTTVNVNPGDADKVNVNVEGQGTIVVTKDPQDGKWKTPDGTVVTPDKDGKLPVPVKPIGEKALVEVTVEKDGVVSEKVAKTAQKVLALLVETLTEGEQGITVTTNPRGAKVSVYLGKEKIQESVTDGLGVATLILDTPTKAGQSYTVKAELEGYLSKESTVDVVGKTQ